MIMSNHSQLPRILHEGKQTKHPCESTGAFTLWWNSHSFSHIDPFNAQGLHILSPTIGFMHSSDTS